MHSSGFTNRLKQETSPYLQQHAHNPVDWYPWGREALDKALREDKPILLSIGYSACHWCHVMAHESFEDAAGAQVMNELFVAIKVDREERPDLDKIYQTAHHLLTRRSGGWPLTMFLMPDDHTPFFAGTYFPKEARYGMLPFTEVCKRVARFFRERRADLHAQNASLRAALQAMNTRASSAGEILNPAPLRQARDLLAQSFDARYGGFGAAPKFPHPTNLERLLRHYAASVSEQQDDHEALEMALQTLRAMALGGIYDHLGGGFCRYSVDEKWMIPHFEKMLYDNGPLLGLYADAWRVAGEALFAQVARATAQWVMREMQAPEGGYYSAQDADSEGEEGRFYAWSPEQVRETLQDAGRFAIVARRFGLDEPANFEHHWHLRVVQDVAAIAHALSRAEAEVEQELEHARQALFAAREQRVHPGRDGKVLTSWNGLMIKGMAQAGRALGDAPCIASAERALNFVRATLWKNGRLLAAYKDGQAKLPAYLDDHVFLIDAILELLQARFVGADLQFAVELMDVVLEHFEDREQGGFFFTAHDHEPLIQRPKPITDDALPSGNGSAASVLVRLGHLLGEVRYIEAAERALKAAWPEVQQFPHACNAMLSALEELLDPGQFIVLRGAHAALRPWQERCNQGYAPRRICLAIPETETRLPGALAAYSAVPGQVIAYVCSGTQCLPPVERLAELERHL